MRITVHKNYVLGQSLHLLLLLVYTLWPNNLKPLTKNLSIYSIIEFSAIITNFIFIPVSMSTGSSIRPVSYYLQYVN